VRIVFAECCAGLLRPGGGGDGDADAGAAREAIEALCAAGLGGVMRRHADGLAPLVVACLGDGHAAVREAARRYLVLLMEVSQAPAFDSTRTSGALRAPYNGLKNTSYIYAQQT
jgi:CLIP-associating protein 1/2